MTRGPALDVLCVGEPMAEFTRDGSDSPRLGYGGDVMNVAVAVSRLGGTSGVASRLGGDAMGQKLRQFMSDEGVNLDHVTVDPDTPTGSYTIHHADDGHSFTYDRDGSAASHWGPDDARALPLDDVSIVHFSGITQAISDSCNAGCDIVLGRAQATKTMISYDPNYRPLLWSIDAARAGLDKVLAHNPVLLPGLDDAQLLTGLDAAEDIVRFFIDKGAAIVAMTAGAQGVYLGIGSDITRVPGLQATCVDASGAGDCFDGGFLTRLAKGDTPLQAAAFANKAAALSVTKHGAAASIPHLAEL